MNYQSKKARQQNWNNLFKANKKLDTELMLKGYDPRKEPRSFLLTLKSISHIPIKDVDGENKPPVQGAKYSFEYYVTLFNREIGGNGSFYGRTYRSKGLPLREVGGTWEVPQEEYIYFHTNYTEKTSFAVIEGVIVKEIGGLKAYGSVGYTLCHLFEFSGLTTVEMIKGSPRAIGLFGVDVVQAKLSKSLTKLAFECRDFPTFDKMKMLIPQNCFCGLGDIIPGLVNEALPSPRTGP